MVAEGALDETHGTSPRRPLIGMHDLPMHHVEGARPGDATPMADDDAFDHLSSTDPAVSVTTLPSTSSS
ncbi:unnamed protein product [Linum trigynum]|uniref:Uncharacterized protein n=1 Tax=Linum trigynum TaxID=586398 RepID=A0AAV2EQY3_9ROSI